MPTENEVVTIMVVTCHRCGVEAMLLAKVGATYSCPECETQATVIKDETGALWVVPLEAEEE